MAKLHQIENLHIKAGRFIQRVPQNILESKVLNYIKLQALEYLSKSRLSIEVSYEFIKVFLLRFSYEFISNIFSGT